MIFLFKQVIFKFHAHFPGCTCRYKITFKKLTNHLLLFVETTTSLLNLSLITSSASQRACGPTTTAPPLLTSCGWNSSKTLASNPLSQACSKLGAAGLFFGRERSKTWDDKKRQHLDLPKRKTPLFRMERQLDSKLRCSGTYFLWGKKCQFQKNTCFF